MRIALAFAVMFALAAPADPAHSQGGAGRDSTACLKCHATIDIDYLAQPALDWANDVHAAAGLGCESCHGGDVGPIPTDDPDEAAMLSMDPEKGFLELPSRLEMAQFCAKCHADPLFMKRFNPQARVDQYTEYLTSAHGRRNAAGDPTPATCTDCHGVHGILPVTSPEAPTYAMNVPETCAGCHTDAEKMDPYGLSTSHYDEYMQSVHAKALLSRGDLAAPACNDCHGNHGATPPEVESVANVCGQCHGRQEKLFEQSSHKEIFELVEEPACITCHENHLVRHPTPEMMLARSAPELSTGRITAVEPFTAEAGQLVAGDSLTATWRVVLAPDASTPDSLFSHDVEIVADGLPPLRLDATVLPGTQIAPEAVLGEHADGLTARLSIEPLYGLPVKGGDALKFVLQLEAAENWQGHEVAIRTTPGQAIQSRGEAACMNCHSPGDTCDVATGEIYVALTTLEGRLREGAARLHRAEVAGMEVSESQFELKSKGTTAAVESRALIHTFDRDRVLARAAEGLEAADAGVAAGEAALAEVQVRRVGLAVSLVLVVLVLIGLYLKIQDINRMRRREETGSA